jgi:hypothetical protein
VPSFIAHGTPDASKQLGGTEWRRTEDEGRHEGARNRSRQHHHQLSPPPGKNQTIVLQARAGHRAITGSDPRRPGAAALVTSVALPHPDTWVGSTTSPPATAGGFGGKSPRHGRWASQAIKSARKFGVRSNGRNHAHLGADTHGTPQTKTPDRTANSVWSIGNSRHWLACHVSCTESSAGLGQYDCPRTKEHRIGGASRE